MKTFKITFRMLKTHSNFQISKQNISERNYSGNFKIKTTYCKNLRKGMSSSGETLKMEYYSYAAIQWRKIINTTPICYVLISLTNCWREKRVRLNILGLASLWGKTRIPGLLFLECARWQPRQLRTLRGYLPFSLNAWAAGSLRPS